MTCDMLTLTEEIARVSLAEQVAAFLPIYSAPVDILEVRTIRRADDNVIKGWCTPSELRALLPDLERQNEVGFDIYVGANARRKRAVSGDAAVLLTRSFFVDCDPANGFTGVPNFLDRVAAAGLPEPAAVVDSGHGCWTYWTLRERTPALKVGC